MEVRQAMPLVEVRQAMPLVSMKSGAAVGVLVDKAQALAAAAAWAMILRNMPTLAERVANPSGMAEMAAGTVA